MWKSEITTWEFDFSKQKVDEKCARTKRRETHVGYDRE
jgi:hypothetical protein